MRRAPRPSRLALLGLLASLWPWPVGAAPPAAPPPPPPPVGPSRAAPLLPAQLGGDAGGLKVGAWVEYGIADLTRRATLRMRLAVVERSDAGTWVEMAFATPGLERLIVKTLIKGDSRVPTSVRRVILKVGGLQPVEIVGGPPAEAAPRWQGPASGTTRRLGLETVRVPAGRIPAEHFRVEGKGGAVDTWMSTKLPLFNLVKLKSRDYIYELAGSGTDAKSEITGRAGKLDLAALRAATGAESQPSK